MSKFEKQIKKRLRNELTNINPTDELRNRVYSENDITPKKPFIFTFKWSYACIFVLALMLITVTAFSLNDDELKVIETNKNQYYAMVTIDVNPSITMVVDEKNQVLSIYGNNNEGKMIIEGENMIGQSFNNVINRIISVETKTNFLTENKDNIINITVSGKDNKTTDEVREKLLKTMYSACDNNNITAELKVNSGLTLNKLKEEVKRRNPIITTEKLNTYTYDELLNELKLYQLEVYNFASLKIEELYIETKKQSMQLSEQESIKNAINKLDSTYTEKIVAYNEVYNTFLEAYKQAQDIYQDYFILEDSSYQQMLISLTEKKKELISKRKLMYELSFKNDKDEYITAVQEITSLTVECTALETALLKIENTANEAYNVLYDKFLEKLELLRRLEDELPTDINYYKFYNVQNTNEKLYTFTNEFLKNFEEQHKNDIAYQKEKLLLVKEQLIAG